jgi:CRP/FNR family cyclic AMP-dependent transcriptional regulator
MSRQEAMRTVLAECPLFADAAVADIEALAAIATASSWPVGTLIFQQGDPSEFMVIVESGRVRLSLNTAGGRELTLRHAARCDVIGEMGVLDRESRSAAATATVGTKGIVIPRKAFERLLLERPVLAAAVIQYLSKRLRETTYQLESVALYELVARLARFILAALKQAHGATLKGRALLTLDLGQSEIAAILGASRPKLNRAFAELAGSGALQRKDRVLDCDVSRLAAIAEADER